MKKIMVVAVHPDDETLGCGGTLFKMKEKGAEIHWVIVTKMDEKSFSLETIKKRDEEIVKVAELYKFDSVTKLDFSPTSLDTVPLNDLICKLRDILGQIGPDTLITPHFSDAHSDHKIVFEACSGFLKSFRYPFLKKVLAMETLSETDYAYSKMGQSFQPNYYIDITHHLKGKLAAMNLYPSEIKAHPFPRSIDTIESLAKIRGAQSGFFYSEAFVLLKQLDD